MIWHVVTFEWQDSVTASDVTERERDLARFRDELDVLVDYRYGPDLNLRENTGDFAIVAVLRSPEDLPLYLDHPAHARLVSERLGPMIKRRCAVQIAVEQG